MKHPSNSVDTDRKDPIAKLISRTPGISGDIDMSTLLVSISHYETDESEEFDAVTREKDNSTYARMKRFSELSHDKIHVSEWHVPCHAIIFRLPDGRAQIFHVNMDSLGSSSLSPEQEKQLKNILGYMRAKSIVLGSHRSWFGRADARELERNGVQNLAEVKLDTDQWWRVLYNPTTDEIWVDMKREQTLIKLRGFSALDELKESTTEVAQVTKERCVKVL